MLNNEQIKALPELHKKYMKQLNCPINEEDMVKTVQCLQDKSVDEIMAHSHLFSECNSKYCAKAENVSLVIILPTLA